jgi:hypothetical protein
MAYKRGQILCWVLWLTLCESLTDSLLPSTLDKLSTGEFGGDHLDLCVLHVKDAMRTELVVDIKSLSM